MFTRDGSGIVDDIDENKLTAPNFDFSRRTIFVIHGYTGKCLLIYLEKMRYKKMPKSKVW